MNDLLNIVGLKYFLACLILVLFSACTGKEITIQGEMPVIERPQASGILRAGAAKVDITPQPGFPMGGHSKMGQISRGQWLRLKARSLYIESPDGSRLALVAADLWSMPAGLGDRVADLIGRNAPDACKLRRDQMIFAATHTHQSPGNFSSSQLYNNCNYSA